jgi:hypothetical protein
MSEEMTKKCIRVPSSSYVHGGVLVGRYAICKISNVSARKVAFFSDTNGKFSCVILNVLRINVR